MKELPDELDATRYRVKYRGNDSVYMGVTLLNEEPVEIFCSFDTVATYETTYMHAAWNVITRLTSMCLQSDDISLEDILKQCERSSLKKGDAPDVLMEVLNKYIPKPVPPKKDVEVITGWGDDLPPDMQYRTGSPGG